MLAISANAINASLYGKLNFNFIRDIAPVASISTIPLVMEVNPAVPAHTVPKFIAYAKANPCKINMASGGTGSPLHVAGELFKMMAGVDMIHVPYRSEALALPDLISGQLQIMFGVMPWPIRPHISEGRRRCPRPNECRSARCGRRSSPTAATPARTPPGEIATAPICSFGPWTKCTKHLRRIRSQAAVRASSLDPKPRVAASRFSCGTK
jgi:hypothetical protein